MPEVFYMKENSDNSWLIIIAAVAAIVSTILGLLAILCIVYPFVAKPAPASGTDSSEERISSYYTEESAAVTAQLDGNGSQYPLLAIQESCADG